VIGCRLAKNCPKSARESGAAALDGVSAWNPRGLQRSKY
jgi:hypothetical protein